MNTSTLRKWDRDVAPGTGTGDLADAEYDARFWAAIDLMEDLLTQR